MTVACEQGLEDSQDSWNSVQQIWLSVGVGLVGTAGPAARCPDKHWYERTNNVQVVDVVASEPAFQSLSLNIYYHHFTSPDPSYVPILLHLCGELYHCIISLTLFKCSSSTSREPFLAMQLLSFTYCFHNLSLTSAKLRTTLWQCWQSLHGKHVSSQQLPHRQLLHVAPYGGPSSCALAKVGTQAVVLASCL